MAPSTQGHQQSGGVQTGVHVGHPITIVNQHAVHAHELTKFLKQHFKVPTAQPYKAEKLTRRTSRTCVGEYDKEKWRKHFARRQDHLNEGFFTSQCEPYQSIGNIELESKHMVLDVLAKCLPKKLPLPGIGFGGGHHVTVSPTNENEARHKQLSPSGDKGGELSEVDMATAGFTFIRDYLKDTRALLVTGKGGQAFEKCAKEIEERKRQLAEDADTSNNTITFLPPEMSHRDVTGFPSSHYSPLQYDRAASALSTESMRSTLSTASRTKPVDSEVEMERMRLSFNRNRRAVIQKLDAIYKVMNALHNMKSRDLKTRVPLPHEAVKYLYREVPVAERGGISRPAGTMTTACTMTSTRPTAPMETIRSSATFGGSSDLSSAQTQGGARHAGGGGKVTSRSHLTRPSFAQGGRTQDGNLSPTQIAWKKFGRVGGIISKMKPQPPEKDPKVAGKVIETWEDLLAVQTHNTGGQQHRLSVNPEKNPGYGMKWLHLHRHHDHHQPNKQPYWLSVSLSSAEKAKRPIQVSANGTAKDKHNPEKTLQSLKENFTKTQRKLTREIMTDLERMERERCRTFRQKFHSCDSSPLFEKTVKHMRDVAPVTQVGIVPDDTDIEIKPSKWYVDMKAEAESAVGKDDPEVSELLQKVARFYLEDSRSIPNSKEKLCLLMMSMPASQLLTIPMQQAIQFVMDNIILAPPEYFSQWLQQRKIPQIIPSSQI
ncbi:uncharacterized protein [Amphiura filiformis]|uniref:uncharacterized protein n=1 Tax=Amphiura filiformis TaxID=82378 RepID=UPI003B214CDD